MPQAHTPSQARAQQRRAIGAVFWVVFHIYRNDGILDNTIKFMIFTIDISNHNYYKKVV